MLCKTPFFKVEYYRLNQAYNAVYGLFYMVYGPLGLPKELGIKGKVFSDAGFIGKPDGYNAAEMNYSSKMRMSAGTGIMWQSPMGMINLDFAWPIMKEDFDETTPS